jgi:phospholipid/cholesterol/gamma-HCH transport system substrate-binding protein
MDNNSRYLWVGIFVIISTTLLVTVWLWFSQDSRKEYNIYTAVFNEPVDGITTNSIVKYNGVEVGNVKQVELDPQDPRNIIIYLNIDKDVLVKASTFATLKSQGVTGLSYIDLRLPMVKDSHLEGNLAPHNTKPYPQIATRPSLFYSLSEGAGSVASNVQDISLQVKSLLNQKNINHVSSILENLDKVSNTVVLHSDELGKSIDNLSNTLNNIKSNTESLTIIVSNVAVLTESLAHTTGQINSMIENVEGNTLQNLNAVLLPTINQAITNIGDSASQIKYLVQTINQNPSILIRGKNVKPGPGEVKENN